MKWSVINLAFLEWKRSFSSDAPRGIGARDFKLLTFFAFLTSLFVFFGLVSVTTMSLRLQETLLGALETGRAELRLNRNWLTANEVGPRSLLAMARDPGLAGFAISPKRSGTLSIGEVRWPRTSQEDVNVEASYENLLRTMPVIALPASSPFWNWVQQQAGKRFRTDEQGCAYPELARRVVANAYLLDENLTPSLGWYESYRKAILARPENSVLARYLPDTVSSWRELTHLILEVTEVINGTSATTYHPFQTIWRDGLPLPEKPALVVPLGFYDALRGAQARPDKLSFAPEGCGAPVKRYSGIFADLPFEDEGSQSSEAEQSNFRSADELLAISERISACLGPGASLEVFDEFQIAIQVEQKTSSRRSNAARNAWRHEDVQYCLNTAGDTTEVDFNLGGDIYFNPIIFGQSLAPITDLSEPYAGGLSAPCNAMSAEDKAMAEVLGHSSVQACQAQDTLDDAGVIFHAPFDTLDFQPPASAQIGVFTAIAKYVRKLIGAEIEQTAPLQRLSTWTLKDATTRLASNDSTTSFLFEVQSPVFPDADQLSSATKNKLKGILSDLDRRDDSVRILEIDVNYERALTQFHVSRSLLIWIGGVVVIVSMVVMFITIHLMILGMLERRLAQYTLFSTFGFTRSDLKTMFLSQVAMSALTGLLGALIVAPLGTIAMNRFMLGSTWQNITYQTLGFEYADGIVIHPSVTQYAIFAGGLLLVFVLMAWNKAHSLGITSFVYPGDLMFGSKQKSEPVSEETG
jgi:hypothetical protein